jgi:thiol-disulfide isomerase/thioredoxin
VVLVEFWTYSCFNCQNAQPHINALYEKYKDDRLLVVGVYSPEFGFEKDISNVRKAVGRRTSSTRSCWTTITPSGTRITSVSGRLGI